ncbi:MAG: hypothetical protein WDZ76_00495 [Pseudohongiellaceae bacterium]
MARSSLFARRIHISGSISGVESVATLAEVERAREFVQSLVKELITRGATFVTPIDAEKTRADGLPICFDWLIWKSIHENMDRCPVDTPPPLVVAVKHHKNEDQIPEDLTGLWHSMRASDLVQIQSAAHWNMNSKRMETQARQGDILITIGGGEGVLFLANLYHDAGKPVIPVNFRLNDSNTGSSRLFDFGLCGQNARHLFQTESSTPHSWLNRIEINKSKSNSESVQDVLGLLEDLVPPKAFVVRLLNPSHSDYNDVQNFFDSVVQPVMEGELGYKLTVVDGNQAFEHARIDQEIFSMLHRSRVVLADITGLRPNCFLELGYALGRALPTMLMAKSGTEHPFDIYSLSGHHWKPTGDVEERRLEFRTHWNAIKNRPPLVPAEPLIP